MLVSQVSGVIEPLVESLGTLGTGEDGLRRRRWNYNYRLQACHLWGLSNLAWGSEQRDALNHLRQENKKIQVSFVEVYIHIYNFNKRGHSITQTNGKWYYGTSISG